MSTKFQKFVAKQELTKRRLQKTTDEISRIVKLSDEELEKILEEPDEKE